MFKKRPFVGINDSESVVNGGFVKANVNKTDAIHTGNIYLATGVCLNDKQHHHQQQQHASSPSPWNKPTRSLSNNNERKFNRTWPPQSSDEAGNEVLASTTASTVLVGDGKRKSALTAGLTIGSTNMGLTAPPVQLEIAVSGAKFASKIREKMGDDHHIRNGVDVTNGNDEHYENGDDSDGNEYDYGPGIVNRLKAKFITLSLRRDYATHMAPVRRVASLEQLLDVESEDEHTMEVATRGGGIVDRTKFLYERNANQRNSFKANNNKSLKRARSMDNVSGVDKSYFNSQNQLRNAFLASKEIIIIEQSKPPSPVKTAPDVTDAAKKNLCNGKVENHRVSPSCIIEELPMPNKVRECMKLFEHPADVNRGGGGVVGGTNGVVPVKAKIQPKAKEIFPPKVSSSTTTVVDREQPKAVVATSKLTVAEPTSHVQKTEVVDGSSNCSVKSRIDAFSGKISKSQQLNSSANTVETLKVENYPPTVPTSTFESPRIVDLVPNVTKPKPATVPDAVNGGGSSSSFIPFKLRSCQPFEGSNSVLIRIDNDDNKPRPHLPNISKPDRVSESAGWDSIDSKYEDDDSEDEDDGAAHETVDAASLNFIGGNVIVGRSSLLKTRNKKLQILFNDEAVSTYEYPSEWALMSEKSDSDDYDDITHSCDHKSNDAGYDPETTSKLNNSTTSGGGLGNYTPMAVSNERVFELGISRAPDLVPPPLPRPSTQNSNTQQDDDELALSLKPAADDENVLWSSTQTSDILF